MYCARHIYENVQRHLINKGVALKARQEVLRLLERCTDVSTDSTGVETDTVDRLLEHVRIHHADHVDYFTHHVVQKLYNNIEVLDNNGWIARGWKNNNAESYNHVLKNKTEWRQMKRVTDLVESVHTLVRLQLKDLKRALHGEGNFTVCGPFLRHRVTYQAWLAMTDERKSAAFKRFLADSGSRQPPATVAASDGTLTVLNTSAVARKPGQRKRPRATRTTTKPAGVTLDLPAIKVEPESE